MVRTSKGWYDLEKSRLRDDELDLLRIIKPGNVLGVLW